MDTNRSSPHPTLTEDVIEQIMRDTSELNGLFIHESTSSTSSNVFNPSEFKHQYSTKYPYIFNHFNEIYQMACSSHYDRDILCFMLHTRRRVQSGELTAKQADIDVGQFLVDRIVKPQLDKANKNKST